ncbi:hypothetical protein F5B19DRAFT_357763 [Rostrohypoxylon terebratum]|nr:hypothetical protein F5B19DRAFT_357763 [Rostrohypoxylon terebratum]
MLITVVCFLTIYTRATNDQRPFTVWRIAYFGFIAGSTRLNLSKQKLVASNPPGQNPTVAPFEKKCYHSILCPALPRLGMVHSTAQADSRSRETRLDQMMVPIDSQCRVGR